jgi:hypothetical protein
MRANPPDAALDLEIVNLSARIAGACALTLTARPLTLEALDLT